MKYIFLSFIIAFFLCEKSFAGYLIKDIAVAESSTNATSAQDIAVKKAETKAFEELIAKMTKNTKIKISSEEISSLVQGIDVRQEKISSNHYSALLDISFNPELVRQFLEKNNISYSESRNKPVIIVPILIQDGHKILWESENPWSIALQKTIVNAPVEIILPIGDFEDAKLIDKSSYDKNISNILKLGNKYNSDEILIAEAVTADGKINISVTAYGTVQFGPESLTFTSDSSQDLFDKGAEGINDYIQKKWQTSGNEANIKATILISDLQKWEEIKKKLDKIADTITIKSISTSSAEVEILTKQDYHSLLSNIAKSGIEIAETKDSLILK